MNNVWVLLCIVAVELLVLRLYWIIMEPARKRGPSGMWEHFNLIAPDKVGVLAVSYLT